MKRKQVKLIIKLRIKNITTHALFVQWPVLNSKVLTKTRFGSTRMCLDKQDLDYMHKLWLWVCKRILWYNFAVADCLLQFVNDFLSFFCTWLWVMKNKVPSQIHGTHGELFIYKLILRVKYSFKKERGHWSANRREGGHSTLI